MKECLGELLQEEQRLLTQATIDNKGTPLNVVFASQAKPRDLSKVQCYSGKEYGHVDSPCKKKVCNYCKIVGYIISKCRRRAQNRGNRTLHTSHHEGSSDATVQQLT